MHNYPCVLCQQTVLTPLKKRRDYRRTKPGEEAVDRLGFPFTDHTKRLKMPLTSSWRRRSTTDGASVGSRPSETSRELVGIESSATTRSQMVGGTSSDPQSTSKSTVSEQHVYNERPASTYLPPQPPPDGELSMSAVRKLSAQVPRTGEVFRSLHDLTE